jgi:hypothetical protein
MGTLGRDFGIVLVLLVALVVWNVVRAARTREQRRHEAARTTPAPPAAAAADAAGGTAPSGWTGPGTQPPTGQMVADYVHRTTCHLWRVDPTGTDGHSVGATTYQDVWTGTTDDHAWYLANAITGRLTASVCTVAVGDPLPPLWVGPRDRTSSVPIVLKEVTLESEDFDRRYRVQALDRKYAFDMVSPRVMEIVMQRDDWTFFLAFSTLVCVCRERFADVAAMQERLALVLHLVEMVPSFVEDDRAIHLPTLPDGTPLDLTALDSSDPATRQALEKAFESMTPEQREQTLQQVQEQGLRFVMGMFGKDVPPEKLTEIEQRLQERRERD